MKEVGAMVSIFRHASQAIFWQEVGLYLKPKFMLPLALGAVLVKAPKYYYKYLAAHKEEPHVTKFLDFMKTTGAERQTVTTLTIRKLSCEIEEVLQDHPRVKSVQTLLSHLFKGKLANFKSSATDDGIDIELFLYNPVEWRFPCGPVRLHLPKRVLLHLARDGKITFPKIDFAPYEESNKKTRFTWSEIFCKDSLYEVCNKESKKRQMSDVLFAQLRR